MMRCNIVYATNEAYVPLAGVSMLSLFENNKHIPEIKVYILADAISNESKERLYGIGKSYGRMAEIVDTENVLKSFEDAGTKGYDNAVDKGLTAYARLYIPELIPDADRVIYLDCDTLIVGDIEPLYTIDLHGNPIGMAFDTLQNRYKKCIGMAETAHYYNSGVMVIDIEKWKEKQCRERIWDHLCNVRNSYPLVDQDFINIVLGQEVTLIDMQFNYLSQYNLYGYKGTKKVYELNPPYYWEESQWRMPQEAVVLHFCGQTFIRPWYSNSKHPRKQDYDKYYELSPWAKAEQKKWKMSLPYKVQYLTCRYLPNCLAVILGKIMQLIFIKKTYG